MGRNIKVKTSTIRFWLLTSLLFLSACASTTNRNFGAANLALEMSARLAADVEVDYTKKISGSATYKKILFFTVTEPENFADGVTYAAGGNGASGAGGLFSFLSSGSPVDQAKAGAAYNALTSAKADFIVAPMYLVKLNKNLFTTEIQVQVIGYAGKIKNIKPAQNN
jgi:hypothetical protein